MSYEDSNELNDYSPVDVMEYLIQKLESRYESILNFNKLIDTLNSSDSFYSLRKDFKLLFNDLEEDFRQGIFSIKALTAQNKKILDDLKIINKENKKITDQLNSVLSENKNLKLQIIKFKDDKSPEIKKENSKKNIKLNDYDKYENNYDNDNDYDNKKINYMHKNSKKNNMEKKEIEQFRKNNYEFEQLSNVKNIMDNMKQNKLKLKMAIEQHFTNNQDNENDN